MPLFPRRHPALDNDVDTDDDENANIDPDLRLRTVRTASHSIAESIRTEERRDARRKRRSKRHPLGGSLFGRKKREQESRESLGDEGEVEMAGGEADGVKKGFVPGARRNVYVNLPLPENELKKGEPIASYPRNKVRTSKYTIVTFIPKNLFEQFRRVANIYFLALVVLQVFPMFGAAAPQVAMLPLVAILTITAIKDGIEDYRRAVIDEQVNNSATTKLGGWRNVNQPTDRRSFFEKLFGINQGPSKGVRRLREKEASGLTALPPIGKASGGRRKSDAASMTTEESTYPMSDIMSEGRSSPEPIVPVLHSSRGRSNTIQSSTAPSTAPSASAVGVVDYAIQAPGTARWERTLWKKLEVGDVVLLRENDQVPADIVILSTSDADGLAYVETKNLDGETNLKVRKSLRATAGLASEEDIEHARFIIDSEPPHANLYTYNGVLRYRARPTEAGAPAEEKIEPVTINELLLRGCAVRNTNWIIGLVVFTGADTKIMLNGGDTPSKRSKIEKETNFNVVMNFVILIVLCLVSAIANGIFWSRTETSAHWYEIGAMEDENIVLNSVITFCACLIAFQNIVPISLYISIEIVKTIQAFFIWQDIEMYYAPLDHPCVPKTWNISDDLGQIEYIFSDKTGTLTQNVMEFKKCSIHGIAYGEGITEAMLGAAKREGREMAFDPEEQEATLARQKEDMVSQIGRTFKNRYMRVDQLTLVAPNLARDMADRTSPQRECIAHFFRALALCHDVLASVSDDSKPYEIDYKAQSPDEAALVATARDVGFPFVNRSNSSIDIEVMGQVEHWVPLRVLEFNSSRKRMSVIVRNPEGKLLLICKGADSVIYQRLREDHDEELKSSTQRDLESFANAGLRTLCIAYRPLTEQEYFDWARVYDAAAAAVKDRDEEIDKACEFMEHSLIILGATALEDKLQVGVPDAIATLHKAGIKLWILTGDKLQTAIEIGFSCNLLSNDMEMMILSADSEEAARAQIEAGLNKIASVAGVPRTGAAKEVYGPGTPNPAAGFAVVIDGDTLRYALDPALKPLFLALGTQCETVVCCRVSPAQKALTVKLVKEGRNAMTLSIGDGANDVAMIQEANIGVGIAGLEGAQASMSADYAIGQFRFLTRLLLVHGRWSYNRVAEMHANFFYKNIIWTISMFFFLCFSHFDATYVYEYTYIMLYNLIFTSLPVIVLGAFDQDTNAAASLAFPQLYVRGIKGLEYTRLKFWLYVIDGVYQSAVCFFVCYAVYDGGTSTSWSGRDNNALWDFGATLACTAVLSANAYVGLNMRYWTWLVWVIVVISTLLVFVWTAIYSAFHTFFFYGEIIKLASSADFWLTIVIAATFALAPRFLIKFISTTVWPMDKDIIREAWVAGDLKDQLGIKHRRDLNHNRDRDPENSPFVKPLARKRGASTAGSEDSAFDGSYFPPTTAYSNASTPDSSPQLARATYPPNSNARNQPAQYPPNPSANRASRQYQPPQPSPLSYYDPSNLPSPSAASPDTFQSPPPAPLSPAPIPSSPHRDNAYGDAAYTSPRLASPQPSWRAVDKRASSNDTLQPTSPVSAYGSAPSSPSGYAPPSQPALYVNSAPPPDFAVAHMTENSQASQGSWQTAHEDRYPSDASASGAGVWDNVAAQQEPLPQRRDHHTSWQSFDDRPHAF